MLFKRFKVLEALAEDDQETVIKVIDVMIAKHGVTFDQSATVLLDATRHERRQYENEPR